MNWAPQNISSVYDCSYEKSERSLDCTDKRNCIEMNGLYDCINGQCSRVRDSHVLYVHTVVYNKVLHYVVGEKETCARKMWETTYV